MVERDVPLLEQSALAEFISDGHYDRHLRRAGSVYAKRRALLVSAMTRSFKKQIEFSPASAGLHTIIRFADNFNEGTIESCAANAGLPLVSTRKYYCDRARKNEFMLGFANLQEQQIEPTVSLFAMLLSK